MLAVSEFKISEGFLNSDCKIIKERDFLDYVAVYDTKKIEDKDVETIINKRRYDIEDKGMILQDNLVFLPKEAWNKISKMITDNYNLEKK